MNATRMKVYPETGKEYSETVTADETQPTKNLLITTQPHE